MVAAAAVRFGQLVVDDETLYWVEARPDEGGRSVIVRRTSDGRIADVTPPPANVRSRVHEYGGAAFVVSEATVYYAEFADQRLYRLRPGGAPEPITPAGDWFYADGCIDRQRRRLVCVREDHTVPGREAVTTLVSVPLEGSGSPGQIVASGHDFFSSPRLSPDGSRLAWIAWRHPQMPWDGTELWIGELAADGTLTRSRTVAGGDSEAILQPVWSPDGVLYVASDRSGWWNLYRVAPSGLEAVHPMAAEFARPPWQIGTSTWAFVGPSRVVAAVAERGRWRLVGIDLTTGALERLTESVEPGESLTAMAGRAVVVGGNAVTPDAVVRVDLTGGVADIIRGPAVAPVPPEFLSQPDAIEFPTGGGLSAHAFHYPPRNPDFTAPAGERPPLVVMAHGGPTAATHARFNLEIQYWTSRGFAVADVNYGGSSGYGRAYRQRLAGQWGVVDVMDCVNAAKFLVAQGEADEHRLAIRGRSAGGYTTLATLAFHPGVFRAGASYYGVADLELLLQDTHKFESRYLETLVGRYPADRDRYRARSPIEHVDRLSCPVVFFQGLEDRVVPPNQARMMADALRAKGLPVALVEFPGEQHGFRKAENIATCLEAERAFYASVFGFAPPAPAVGPTLDAPSCD